HPPRHRRRTASLSSPSPPPPTAWPSSRSTLPHHVEKGRNPLGTPYVGEIRLFAGNFSPAGWMTCDGQILAISEYDTLFNLIGTTYGGDGQSTFALPNLAARVPI